MGPGTPMSPGKPLQKQGVTLLSYVIILSLIMSHMMNWLSLMLHTESTHASAMSKFVGMKQAYFSVDVEGIPKSLRASCIDLYQTDRWAKLFLST